MLAVAERFGWTLEYVADLTALQFNEIHLRLEKHPVPAVIAYFPQ